MTGSNSNVEILRAQQHGGFMIKWKGMAASVAPAGVIIVLATALGTVGASAQSDISNENIPLFGPRIIINGDPVGGEAVFVNEIRIGDSNDDVIIAANSNSSSFRVLPDAIFFREVEFRGDVEVDGNITLDATVEGVTITDGTATMTGGDLVTTGAVNSGTLTTTGAAEVGTDLAVGNDLDVTGHSVFDGTVDISGETRIENTFDVEVGLSTLNVNGSSINMQVGTSTSTFTMTTDTVELSANGSGFEVLTGGTARVTGTTESVMTGGTSSLTVSNSGVSLAGTGGAPVVLSGVADPVGPTDAVNLRTLERELGALEDNMSAGIAQSMAMTQLPAPAMGSDFSFGVALGNFNGQTAIAMGGGARLDGGMMIRGAASFYDAGGAGVAAGIGWSW
jgi:cytoskeletal protein CcmA (bactofilin family)